MHYLEETNVIISGHVSSGTTITALILAYMLKKKFVYAGGTYKFIAKQLGYDPKSGGLIDYEKKYGEKWDILWENYIAWKVQNERNLLVNSKIAGFLVDRKEWIFEAFITASPDVRAIRAGTDKRTENIELRDKELNSRWKKMFDIEFMNSEEIRETHDFLCLNDELTIAETVFEIFKVMREALGLTERLLLSDIQKVTDLTDKYGKDILYERLNKKDQLITHSEVFKDWIENFGDDLDETEPEWRGVVEKFAAK